MQFLFLVLLSNPIPTFSRTESKEMGITSSADDEFESMDVSEKEQFDAELPVSYTSIPGIGGVVANNRPNPYSTTHHSVMPSTRLSMKNLLLLSLFVNVASACGNNAYRCVKEGGSVAKDWEVTWECMQQVGFDATCTCYHMVETYADPSGSDINDFKNDFKKCCAEVGYHAREC